MNQIVVAVACLILFASGAAMSEDKEAGVRAAIQAFHNAFNEGFTGPAEYATADWNHVNPYGGRDRGREASLKAVREVHQTFLKGTTDTIKDMDIRFATADVAVATVSSVMSPFTSPDGVKHNVERHIRTFVLTKSGGRWQIMQDHNTTIVELPR